MNVCSRLLRTRLLTVCIVIFCVSATNASDVTSPAFKRLLGNTDAVYWSSATAVAPDGSAVAGDGGIGQNAESEAVFWRPGEPLVYMGDFPGGDHLSWGTGISNGGDVVVGGGIGNRGVRAFRYTPVNGLDEIGDLPGGPESSIAYGVSGDGSIIVGEGNVESGSMAFRWENAIMEPLGRLYSTDVGSAAFDVSTDGQVIVGTSYASFLTGEAFMWTQDAGMVGLGIPEGSTESHAAAVSANGEVVVGWADIPYSYNWGDHGDGNDDSADQGFYWTATEGWVALPDLPGGELLSRAWDVSADGSRIVGLSHTDSGFQAFLYDTSFGFVNLRDYMIDVHGMTFLEDWRLVNAQAISDDGSVIVGTAVNPEGFGEGFVINLPEPGSLLWLIAGGLTVLKRRGS